MRLQTAVGVVVKQGDDAAMAQARGFAQRHGIVIDAIGNLDVSDEGDTSGARSEDLSSSGWIRGVDQGSVDRRPNTTGAPQAPGASSVATQPSVPVTGTPTTAAGKTTKLANAEACAHRTTEENQYGVITCRDCKSWWCDAAAFKAMTGIVRKTHLSPESGAQKCLSCGTMTLTAYTGVLKACQSCSSASLVDPATTFAKSASRQTSDCNHTNSPRTQLGNGASRCDLCGKVSGVVPGNEPSYRVASKSAIALSKSSNRRAGGFDHSDDALRNEIAEKLYRTAEAETNRTRKAALTKLAQAIDAGTLPIPANLAARTGAVRLSSGQRHAGSGRDGWAARHGF